MDIVVTKCPSIVKFPLIEDKPLQVDGNSLFIFYPSLDEFNRITWLSLNLNRLTLQCFHTYSSYLLNPEYKMKESLVLNIIVTKCPSFIKFLLIKNKPLLLQKNAFFIFDLGLHILNRFARLNIKMNDFPCLSLHVYHHIRIPRVPAWDI